MKNKYEIRGDVTVIFLERKDGQILETMIDTCDLEKVKNFPNKWFACYDTRLKSYYVHGHVTRYRATQLHRWLMDEPKGLVIDHKNHKTLDNRRLVNLRAVTQMENVFNKKGSRCDSKSGIRGVSWHKGTEKWVVRIYQNGKVTPYGYFKDLEDARIAAKNAYERIQASG